jgi:cytochrome c-type biogenesis protein CcmH
MVSFTFIAGVLTGVLACLIAVSLRRVTALPRARRSYLFVSAAVVTFAAAAAVLYFTVGSRHPPLTGAVAPAAAGAPSAKSMQDAVAGLEARLASGGGSSADWELLAKAYDFLGRPEDVRRAREHVASPSAPVSAMSVEALMSAAAAAGNATGPGAAPLPASAPEAPQPPPGATAQSWADYADVLASSAGGSLAGAAGNAIDQALALDPVNAKALWLKASQAHEQRRFADALGWWRKLRAALPADSPDLRIIDGNIAEDTQLGGFAAAPAARAVAGTVSIDSRLSARVQPDATLFIYAKAADSPGPPLAVLRTTAGGWPVRFRLDDSMAMLPSRRLSQFGKVVIEARVSRSGQATPASGDFYVTSPVVNPGAGQPLALVINREID